MKQTVPRYTSRNEFANMLERRARELGELESRMRLAGDMDEAADCICDAQEELAAAVKWLRDAVRA